MKTKKYKDFWVKIIGCLVASQLIDMLNREESLFQRLTSVYFYTDLFGGFVIALLLWETLRFVIRFLDKGYSWGEQPLKRTFLQIMFGVALPSLLSFVFTLLFMKLAYNQDIFKTNWLYNEFYVVILVIVLINVLYFTWWLYLEWKEQKSNALELANQGTETVAVKAPHVPVSIEVTKAGKTIILPQEQIAYAFLNNGYCYLKTFPGEGYLTSYTLDEISRNLGEQDFFRVNRQILINRKTCRTYRAIDHGKIALDLEPLLKEQVIVSQKRARDFRKWISSGVYA